MIEKKVVRSSKIVVINLVAWLAVAVIVALNGWFERASAPVVAGTVWGLTILALLSCFAVPVFRAWAMTVDIRWLVGLHLTRFVGFYFLYLCGRGELPSSFAVPAGIGDIVVACLAVLLLVLSAAGKRNWLLGWNSIGLIDILMVVFTALRVGLADWKSMHALREFPLSLLPMFFVPLIIASHALIYIRAAHIETQRVGRNGQSQ